MYQLVGHVRPVELGGIDVVDPGLDGVTEYRQGEITVLRRPEDTGARKLHGAESHAADGAMGQLDALVRHGVHTARVHGPAGNPADARSRSLSVHRRCA